MSERLQGPLQLDAVPADNAVMLIGDDVAVSVTPEEAFVLADDLRTAAEAALRRRDCAFVATADRRRS